MVPRLLTGSGGGRTSPLACGGVAMEELAGRFGTPLYVYDGRAIEERYRSVTRAFGEADLLVAYSVKANGNLAILDRLGALGAGADIASQGELFRATRAGIPPERIVFAGVGKTETELLAALEEGIYGFNVESEGELRLLDRVGGEVGVTAPFALRVNPDIMSPTPHEYTRTGHADAKFGIPAPEVLELYRWASGRPNLQVRGIDVHLGSGIVDPRPYRDAVERLLELAGLLRDEGIELEYLDLGGGFGVAWEDGPGMPLKALGRDVAPRIRDAGLRLVLEPGRYLVAEAGTLLVTVLYVKRAAAKTFVVTDGGMTELLRPSHYGGYHPVEPVIASGLGTPEPVDVVGPVCESGDFLARDWPLPVPEPGEVLAVRIAGAYGSSMAFNYNGRRRPAEVLVEAGHAHVIRAREGLDDLIRGEVIPPRSHPSPTDGK